jgi:hypothetical protein
MMSREVACSSHKTKRVLLCYPGKPLLRIELKWEQATLGADHDIAPFAAILDARDDMSGLGGRFGGGRGSGTRAGSRGSGFGWTLGSGGLLEQMGEISHLLLQRSELSLQGAKLRGEREERGRQRWQSALNGGRWLRWEGSQAAMMQAGQDLKVLTAHPFFAAIVGMVLKRKLSLHQPAAHGFDIDAETTARLGHRHTGHEATPFVRCVEQERKQAGQTPGSLPRRTPGKSSEKARWLNTQA